MPFWNSLTYFWRRLNQHAAVITAGGRWSVQLPDAVQRNMRWFFMDGTFSSCQDAINVTYLTLFVLALGATKSQIGLMTALSSLSAVLLLLPGALLSEQLGKRKWVVLAGGGGVTRLAILALAVLPFLVEGKTAVTLAILLKVLMDGFSFLSNPAWTSMVVDIVPFAWRGRYFATRNIVMGVANMLVTLIAGQIITGSADPIHGYQVVYFIAFFFGASASFSFAHIEEAPRQPDPRAVTGYKPALLWQSLKADANFRNFAISQMIWNFGLNIAGPFFTVYQVEELHSSAVVVGIMAIIASLAGLPAQRLFGNLNDRWGARKVALLNGFLIPGMVVLWVFTRAPWHPAPIQALSGILWAGYNLASFNFLLSISNPQTLPRHVALYQIAVMASTAVGATVGGFVVEQWGFIASFLISAGVRLAGMIVFWRMVKNPVA